MKRSICLLLILALLLPPATYANPGGRGDSGARTTEQRHNAVLGALLDELNIRYERIMASAPAKMVDEVEVARKAELNTVLSQKKADLEAGRLTVQELRNEVTQINQQSLQEQKTSFSIRSIIFLLKRSIASPGTWKTM